MVESGTERIQNIGQYSATV